MEHPRILIAEDELIIGMDLLATVEEAGYVADGPHADLASAMVAAQKTKPDLAILDIRLADGDAYSFAEKLMREDVPVIFHSAEVRPQDVVDRYPDAIACSKPCPPTQMIDLAEAVLERA